jgi:hypothetical protein
VQRPEPEVSSELKNAIYPLFREGRFERNLVAYHRHFSKCHLPVLPQDVPTIPIYAIQRIIEFKFHLRFARPRANFNQEFKIKYMREAYPPQAERHPLFAHTGGVHRAHLSRPKCNNQGVTKLVDDFETS